MTENTQLKELFNAFSFDVIDEYKEVLWLVRQNSRIFGRKHYDEAIAQLGALRERAARLAPRDLTADSELEKELIDLLPRARHVLGEVTLALIRLQEMLRDKAHRKGRVKMSDCKVEMDRINEETETLNRLLRALDVKWADYLEETE